MRKSGFLSLALVLFTTVVLADDPGLGPPFTVSLGPGSSQSAPALAYNYKNGEYLLVWHDDRQVDASGFDLFGQRLAADGRPLGKAFVISDAPGHQRSPAVAYNGLAHQYLVVWTDEREAGLRGRDVFAQRVHFDGTLIGANLPVAAVPGDQRLPAVVHNYLNDQYLVVWWGRQIEGQPLRADGEPLGPALTISSDNAGSPAAVAYNPYDQQYLVAWSSGAQIFSQRLEADGRLAGPNFAVSFPPPRKPPFDPHLRFSAFAPAVAHHFETNQYLVFWSEGLWVTLDPFRSFEGFGQRLTADGRLAGSKFRVADAPGTQTGLNLVYNWARGEYLALWSHSASFLPQQDLLAQRIGPDGGRLGPNFQVSTAPGNQSSPAVAYNNADDLYLTVWSDDRALDLRRTDLFGQRVLYDGRLDGAELSLAADPDPGPTPALGSQFHPALAYNSRDNQYLAVWVDAQPGVNAAVVGQLLDAQGRGLGPSFVIAPRRLSYRTTAVAYNRVDNQYLVAWAQQPDPSMLEVWARRVSAEGQLLGGPFAPPDGPGPQHAPAITYNSLANQYLIVWEDYRNFAADRYDIYGQLVSGGGERLGANQRIAAGPREQVTPAVAYNSTDNQYLVAWADNQGDVFNPLIYARRLNADAGLEGAAFLLSEPGHRKRSPAIAYNPPGNEYLVVWEDARRAATGFDLFGQRVAADGRLLDMNVPISTAPGLQEAPELAYGGADVGYLVVWFDVRNFPVAERAVYAQRLDGAGRLVGGELLIAPTSPRDATGVVPAITYNHRAGQYLVIWDDDRDLSTARDVLGRQVRFPGERPR